MESHWGRHRACEGLCDAVHPLGEVNPGNYDALVEVPFYDRVDSAEAAVEAVRERLTSRTVALYLCTPSNPTGRVLPQSWLEALADFNAVIRQNPSMWQALLVRGHLHRRMGNRAEALADYEATLRVNDKIEEARVAIRELQQGR